MAPDSSNTKKTLFWFANRAGSGAIAGVATWAFFTWLRLQCGPFVKDKTSIGEAQKLLEEVIGNTDEFTAVLIARGAIAEPHAGASGY